MILLLSLLHYAFLALLLLLLAYTLAPYAVYPTQLIQGVSLLRHLTQTLGLKPQNIMIGGDSAGANLTLGIMSHLSHPHPSVAPLELEQPLRGIVLLAPWTSFASEGWESVKFNKDKDLVTPEVADAWSSSFLGGKPRDQYNEPITADAEWWRDLKAEEILVVGGGDEILLDSIKTFAGKVKVSDGFLSSDCFEIGTFWLAISPSDLLTHLFSPFIRVRNL